MRTALIISTLACAFGIVDLHGQANERTYKTFQDTTFLTGDKIIAPAVGFSLSGGSYILPEYHDSVQVIADFLTRHANISIEIGRHTDDRGSERFSTNLSEHQAGSTKKLLVAKFNIDPERIVVKGYGGSDPIIPIDAIQKAETKERMEELYAINRRLEIMIIKKHVGNGDALVLNYSSCDSLTILQLGVEAIIAKYPGHQCSGNSYIATYGNRGRWVVHCDHTTLGGGPLAYVNPDSCMVIGVALSP